MDSSQLKIRIGTRASALALWQANFVSKKLKESWPTLEVEIVKIVTTGDKNLNSDLSEIGGKALFLKEIEEALLSHQIDLAVHSMKDVPGELPSGLIISTILKREDPRDVLISQKYSSFQQLPPQSIVGTSSLRRISQLKKIRSDLIYKSIRGNVDTRIKKLKSGDYDALVLAAAGVKRLGMEKEITQYLDLLPAVGQGAIGIERREEDQDLARFIDPLNDLEANLCVTLERIFLQIMEGNCQTPLGCLVTKDKSSLTMKAYISDLEGGDVINREIKCDSESAPAEMKKLALEMKKSGGDKILNKINNLS